MEEVWKSIEELSDLSDYGYLKKYKEYEFSDLGNSRVKVDLNKNKYIEKKQNYCKSQSKNNKYNTVKIGKKRLFVHRIVALLFLRKEYEDKRQNNVYSRLEVHHIDNNKRNNKKDNLKWLTQQEHSKEHA